MDLCPWGTERLVVHDSSDSTSSFLENKPSEFVIDLHDFFPLPNIATLFSFIFPDRKKSLFGGGKKSKSKKRKKV